MMSVSENIFLESDGVLFLQNKICDFLKKIFISTLAILYYETICDDKLTVSSFKIREPISPPLMQSYIFVSCNNLHVELCITLKRFL